MNCKHCNKEITTQDNNTYNGFCEDCYIASQSRTCLVTQFPNLSKQENKVFKKTGKRSRRKFL